MLEFKPSATSRPEETVSRKVQFFIGQQLVSFKGNWTWDLPAVELFCSDVIPVFQSSTIAAIKCIIHTDDLVVVQNTLHTISHKFLNIRFRIITSWGKVYTIEGEGLFEVETDERFF